MGFQTIKREDQTQDMESEVEVDASFNFRIGTYLVLEQSQEELDDMCQEIDPISGINIDSVKLSTFQ